MSDGLRVLIAGSVLGQPMGGVRRHNAELLPRVAALIAADGGRMTILEGATPIDFALPDSIERIRTSVVYQPAPVRAAQESRALRSALDGATRAGRPYHLVHTGHLPAPKRLGTPYTITIHDLRSVDLDRAPFTRRLIGRRILGAAFGNALRIGAVSQWMKSRIADQFHIDGQLIHVIGNGSDHLPHVPRQERAAGEEPFLLHVGHVEPRKNLDLFVRALAFDKSLPRAVLAGRSAPGAWTALEQLATDLNVRHRIEFYEHPTDEQIARLYATCACAVFPSRLEGFGIGPAEALRAGAPVAASNIPAHVEFLGPSAALFGTDDPEGLASAVHAARSTDAPAPPPRSWDDCADAWHTMWRAAIDS